MREISCKIIKQVIQELCISSCYKLPLHIRKSLEESYNREKSPLAKEVLQQLILNAKIAQKGEAPLCQDTGMTVIFVDIGQDLHIIDGNIETALHAGVRDGYKKGFMRKSVVLDPIRRENTMDNTPPVIYYNIVPGKKLKLTVIPKGFGSENMSRIKMMSPSEGIDGIRSFIVETVVKAGAKACPPLILGIGIGGTFEKCAFLSKKALLRKVGSKHKDSFWAKIENDFLCAVNKTKIGPQGLSGVTTAFAVFIETFPTHIAALPVSVNILCHAARKYSRTL